MKAHLTQYLTGIRCDVAELTKRGNRCTLGYVQPRVLSSHMDERYVHTFDLTRDLNPLSGPDHLSDLVSTGIMKIT